MSVRYQIAKRIVKLTGMKKLFRLPQDELLKKAEQMNRKRQFHVPKDTKARYADRMILDCHCYPMLTFFPEGKRAYEEITALLSQD